MRRIGASIAIACCLILATTGCGGNKKFTVSVDDLALIATASGPTPTPLANGLRATPTQSSPTPALSNPSATQYAAPAAGPSASTPRKVIEEFYNAVLAKRNIASFLTPELRARSDGDGYAILGAPPPMRFFSVDGQEIGADGATATVTTTLSVANGTAKLQFAMKHVGDTWLIDRITA